MAQGDPGGVGFDNTLESPHDGELPSREGELSPGQTFDRYTILSMIGRGGMGQVYAAYDPKLDRRVALKILRSTSGSGGQKARQRLVREAKALAKLNHRNVVGVFDVGEYDSQVFIAMEYVDGRHFGQWLEQEAPDWKRTLDVVRAAARGLAAAHEIDLVHRDVKPENIVVSAKGEVRVIDFGIARSFESEAASQRGDDLPLRNDAITEVGTILGTPRYMAEEQFYGTSSAKSDQFSLALCLYEALYGNVPFSGSSVHERVKSLRQGVRETKRDTVPEWIFPVLKRALSADPKERYDTIEDFCEALHPPSFGGDETLEEHLRSVEQDHNPYVKSRSRSNAGVVLLTLTLLEIAFTFARTYEYAYTPFSSWELLGQASVVVVGFIGVLAIWRTTFWANQYNRRWTVVALGTVSSMFLHRVIGVVADLEPTAILQTGTFILCICMLMSAHLSRWLYLVAFVAFLLAAIGYRYPSWARIESNIAGVLCMGSVYLLWRRESLEGAAILERGKTQGEA